MEENQKTEAFYEKLKGQLYDTALWPSEYLYKFIVETDGNGVEGVEDIFNNMGAVIKRNESKKGKYTSVSIHVIMKSPEDVVAKYKEVAEKIEGVISL
ncbi:DUF493 family protein [Bizionia argentinensis JUB59]|uniref:DUF493 family protein n=1 Tax=Bizionia argentinensis JUB59 TaxID=1046627 RepID=G2ECF3_9FLAO|nr:DUF493 family protein [Bizionia argentinensis]EGV43842.1 DUF493 family protein [Bizionia argentinensis JUB59]